MKRFVLLAALAAAAPLAGCDSDGSSPTMNHPFKKKSAAAAAPAKANYFEVKKEGKTYVLSNPESIPAVNTGKANTLNLREMPKYGPKGETVYFENNGYTDLNRLMAEYRKSKGLS